MVLYLLVALLGGGLACPDREYLSNSGLLDWLEGLAAQNPDLAQTYPIGFSANGVELRVLELSAVGEEAEVPQVKLVGGVHGNEPPSTEVLVDFAEHLVKSYRSEERYVTWLLNNTRIHILPRLNPDGYTQAQEGLCNLGTGRKNGRGVDLNRGFPKAEEDEKGLLEPEVEAVVRWSDAEKFTLGASLHTGALVAVYPLDAPLGDVGAGRTPDEDVFAHLARTYAGNHRKMTSGIGCNGKDHFPDGVINGAAWYPAPGSMMDYSYLYAGTMELTLELHCCKFPAPRLLCPIFQENKLALMKLVGESLRGVRGIVASNGIPLENAAIRVIGRDMPVFTNSRGYFFRVLLPGRYVLEVEMIGMKTNLFEVEVKQDGTALLEWTFVQVDLVPEGTDLDEMQPSQRTPLYDRGGLDPEEIFVYTSSSVDWLTTEMEYEYMEEHNVSDTSVFTRKLISSAQTSLQISSLYFFSCLVIYQTYRRTS